MEEQCSCRVVLFDSDHICILQEKPISYSLERGHPLVGTGERGPIDEVVESVGGEVVETEPRVKACKVDGIRLKSGVLGCRDAKGLVAA